MSVRLRVVFADQALLDQTVARYIAAVERGEMTDAEAVEDLTALTLGMLTIEIES
ncbi:MAG TPA: hypothetical protein VIY49_01650 [Bryobacteraceae bacterium]